MRRLAILTLTICFAALPAVAHADHVPPQLGIIPGPLPAPPAILSEGPIRFVGNTPTGRSFAGTLGEVPPFTRDGKRYIVAGSSVYGFSVIDVTDPASPTVVSEYASAFGCPGSALDYVLDGGEDPVEVALGYGGWENDISWSPDGEWVVMGMDAPGRCHDPVFGGIEIVNLSDVTNPTLVHLVRNIGQSHSVTLDPARPWLAYISTSDSEDVLPIVDFKSCIGTPAATCRPSVAAAVFDWDYMPALFDKNDKEEPDRTTDGCHDLRFRGTYAYCAAVGSTLILDVSKVLRTDGRLSGTRLTEGDRRMRGRRRTSRLRPRDQGHRLSKLVQGRLPRPEGEGRRDPVAVRHRTRRQQASDGRHPDRASGGGDRGRQDHDDHRRARRRARHGHLSRRRRLVLRHPRPGQAGLDAPARRQARLVPHAVEHPEHPRTEPELHGALRQGVRRREPAHVRLVHERDAGPSLLPRLHQVSGTDPLRGDRRVRRSRSDDRLDGVCSAIRRTPTRSWCTRRTSSEGIDVFAVDTPRASPAQPPSAEPSRNPPRNRSPSRRRRSAGRRRREAERCPERASPIPASSR